MSRASARTYVPLPQRASNTLVVASGISTSCKTVDEDRTRFEHDRFAVTRQIVSPLAIDLDRRIRRRDLHDLAVKLRQQRFDAGAIRTQVAVFVTVPSVSSVSVSAPQRTVKR